MSTSWCCAEAARPNDMWQAEHTELDVMVLDEAGRPPRPWMTAILDDHSRAAAGYMVFLGDPSTAQTSRSGSLHAARAVAMCHDRPTISRTPAVVRVYGSSDLRR